MMERISGVNIEPHFCRIEDKDIDFYNDFNIIALGLDSVEARSYINNVACSFLGLHPSFTYFFFFLGAKLLIYIINYLLSCAPSLLFLNEY